MSGNPAAYEFDRDELSNEIYALLCMFVASESLAQLPSKDRAPTTSVTAQKYRRVIQNVQERHFELNASHALLYIAGMSRILDERTRGILDRPQKCGLLYEPIEGAETALNLREACNKIIHADNVEFLKAKTSFELAGGRLVETDYFEPAITLYGKRNRARWKAKVDVVEFCRASLEVCEFV